MKRLLVTIPALLALVSWACHRDRVQTRDPSALEDDDVEVTVEAMWDEAPGSGIEIPDLLNPYENGPGACPCCCAAQCGGAENAPEFEAFVTDLKDRATAKAIASADAILEAGPDLVKHEGWMEMARDAMDLLSNPILVVVQLPSGKWRKVTFETLPDLDVDPVEVYLIQKSVGDRMKAALKASMIGHGMGDAEADAAAGKIVKAYLKKLSP